MRKVYKYELTPGVTTLTLPVCVALLTVASQGNGVFLWALVDTSPNSPMEERCVLTLATGEAAPQHCTIQKYIGSVFRPDGLVFHCFEVV